MYEYSRRESVEKLGVENGIRVKNVALDGKPEVTDCWEPNGLSIVFIRTTLIMRTRKYKVVQCIWTHTVASFRANKIHLAKLSLRLDGTRLHAQ